MISRMPDDYDVPQSQIREGLARVGGGCRVRMDNTSDIASHQRVVAKLGGGVQSRIARGVGRGGCLAVPVVGWAAARISVVNLLADFGNPITKTRRWLGVGGNPSSAGPSLLAAISSRTNFCWTPIPSPTDFPAVLKLP